MLDICAGRGIIAKMVIRALVLGVIGVAAFAAVYFARAPEEPALDEPNAVEQNEPAPESPATLISAPPPDPVDTLRFELRPGAEPIPHDPDPPRTIRDVTPDNMTAGPRVTGTLARVEGPAKARTERFYNAIIVSAGLIKVREQEIRLAGIAAPDFEQRCGEGAASWPCGRMARAALRSLIRGRAIDCEVPAGADALPDPAACSVGGENISEWLVAQGWAKRSGEPFEAAETIARDAKLGLWSEGRPDAQPAEVATSG